MVTAFHKSLAAFLLKELTLKGTLELIKQAWDEASPSNIPDDALIRNLGLSVRATYSLTENGFTTAGAVRKASDRELLRNPNFGRVSLKEVRAVLGPALYLEGAEDD